MGILQAMGKLLCNCMYWGGCHCACAASSAWQLDFWDACTHVEHAGHEDMPVLVCAGALAFLAGSPDSWDQCMQRGDVVHVPTAATNNGS